MFGICLDSGESSEASRLYLDEDPDVVLDPIVDAVDIDNNIEDSFVLEEVPLV